MMLSTDIGIDLGTASILVYIKGRGVVLKEPSVVAFDRDTNQIKAIGEEARLMIGRTPGNIVAVRPLRQGVISDYTVTEKMLKYFIKKAVGKKTLRKPRISVCIPSGATEVDENDGEVARGDVGELCVKGPGVMSCYYNDPAATAETLKNGWLYTGDMAMQDEDGFIFLVDRKKDVIVSGGENIYPVQIENFMSAYEKVRDVAVIGLPDKRLGEITGAIVSIKEGMECTQEEIDEFCKGLPRYKRPKKVIFAEVPRNATGKIEKPLLRKIYGADKLVEQQNKG